MNNNNDYWIIFLAMYFKMTETKSKIMLKLKGATFPSEHKLHLTQEPLPQFPLELFILILLLLLVVVFFWPSFLASSSFLGTVFLTRFCLLQFSSSNLNPIYAAH